MNTPLLQIGFEFETNADRGKRFIVKSIVSENGDDRLYSCRDIDEKVRPGQKPTIYGFSECNFGPGRHTIEIFRPQELRIAA